MVRSVRTGQLRRACLFAILAATWTAPAFAQSSFETVHEFVQGPGGVHGRMVQAVDGHLYGVTRDGGAHSGGTVFVIRRSAGGWMPAVTLHDFRSPEGTHPVGGLIEGSPGQLYGTTSKAGGFGGGTVYRISIFGTFQVLASLNPPLHGAQPVTELTRGPDLNFYGTAMTAGPAGYGTVFRITPAGALTVLHAFAGPDGAYPAGALGLAFDGNFYGTTWVGGAQSRGTVFRISRTGAFTQLHSFGRYGAVLPTGRLTLAIDGALYGAAAYELFCLPLFCGEFTVPGALFKVTTSGIVSEEQTFVGFAGPGAGVTQGSDGWLYGSTNGRVGIYRLRPGTAFEWIVLENSSVNYGVGATGGSTFIEASDGRLYMGTVSGGVGGYGTVFSADAGGDVRVHHSFRSGGFHPASTLAYRDGGMLVGSTYSGGTGAVGSYFALYGGGVVDTIADQPVGHGSPIGDLLNGFSSFFAPTDARIMNVMDRSATMAWQHAPSGRPAFGPGGALYAATQWGSDGAIVRINADEIVHQFNGADGRMPSGLVEFEGVLYGVTREGGAFDQGTVFSVKPDGTFATLHHFSGTDGKWPVAALALVWDESTMTLVGTTTAGGNTAVSPDGSGTVFRVSIDGRAFSTLHAFGPGEGNQPIASVALAPDGRFYGTTFSGGLGLGTVYSVALDGTFETLHRFAPGQGAFPYGGLTPFDGALYGTTVFGGRGNVGTIFKLRMPAPVTGLTVSGR